MKKIKLNDLAKKELAECVATDGAHQWLVSTVENRTVVGLTEDSTVVHINDEFGVREIGELTCEL